MYKKFNKHSLYEKYITTDPNVHTVTGVKEMEKKTRKPKGNDGVHRFKNGNEYPGTIFTRSRSKTADKRMERPVRFSTTTWDEPPGARAYHRSGTF